MPSPKWYRVEKDGKTITRFNKRTKRVEPKLYRSYLKALADNPDADIFQLITKKEKVGERYTPPDWTLGKKKGQVRKSRFTGKVFGVASQDEVADYKKPSKEDIERYLHTKGSDFPEVRRLKAEAETKQKVPRKAKRAVMTLRFSKQATKGEVARDLRSAWPRVDVMESDYDFKEGGGVVKFSVPLSEWDKGRKKFMKSQSYKKVRT